MFEQQWRHLLKRPQETHKYDFGHVLVIGGSPGMEGAPLLTAEAALRIGAGLATIASIPAVIHQVAGRSEAVMTLGLRTFSKEQVSILTRFIEARHVTVLAIGPGLPKEAWALVRAVTSAVNLPVVLDAGGINAWGDNLTLLKQASKQNSSIVLTPHPGEFARLGYIPQAAATDKTAGSFAKEHGVTLLLKHARSFVAYPDGSSYHNTSGNPGLATAGTGDVLTGVIAGLLAQKTPVKPAVAMAAYIHGVAGDLAAKEKTQPGMIATDVINKLPNALQRMV